MPHERDGVGRREKELENGRTGRTGRTKALFHWVSCRPTSANRPTSPRPKSPRGPRNPDRNARAGEVHTMPQHLTTTGDPAPLFREAMLWRAVLSTAIADAQLPRPCSERTEARLWLAAPSHRDFDHVVEFAGFNPVAVREGLRPLIASWSDTHIGGVGGPDRRRARSLQMAH